MPISPDRYPGLGDKSSLEGSRDAVKNNTSGTGRGFSKHSFILNPVSEKDMEKARMKKAGHVYDNFIAPYLEDVEDGDALQTVDVMHELDTLYNYEEIRDALEYGVENSEELELLEEDKSVFLYTEK